MRAAREGYWTGDGDKMGVTRGDTAARLERATRREKTLEDGRRRINSRGR